MRQSGKVVIWNRQRCFGFIEPSTGGKDVYVHMRGLKNCSSLEAGELVSYEIGEWKGNPSAVEVEVLTKL
jgi:cold shock protein